MKRNHIVIYVLNMSIYILSPAPIRLLSNVFATQPTATTLHRAGGTPTRVMLLGLVWLLILSQCGKKLFSNILFSNSAGCVCSADADMVDPAKVCKT